MENPLWNTIEVCIDWWPSEGSWQLWKSVAGPDTGGEYISDLQYFSAELECNSLTLSLEPGWYAVDSCDSFGDGGQTIYVDGGYKKSYTFIRRIWSPHLNKLITNEIDPKSKLQEITQKKYHKLPEYILIKKEGVPHSPKFTISLNTLNFQNIKAKYL